MSFSDLSVPAAGLPEPGTHGSLTALGGEALIVAEGALLGADGQPFNPTIFEFTSEDGTVYSVEKKKGLRWMQDRNGNTVNVSPAGVVHSSGKGITFDRDSDGRIYKITDPMGEVLRYEYESGNLTAAVDREGKRTTFAYNGKHDLVDIIDPRGKHAIRNEYSPTDGRLVASIDADELSIEYTHNLAANQEVITDRTGAARVLTYDSDGNVTKETDAEGGTITRTFDAQDNRTGETDALGNRTEYTYDSVGNLISVRDQLGKTTSWLTYNAWGQVVTSTDALGHQTVNTYDSNGNLRSTRDAAGYATTFDDQGRLTQTLYPDGTSTSATYDEEGRRLTSTDRGGRVTTMEYDGVGRLKKTTYHDQTFTSTEYYLNGWVKSSTDARGHTTRYSTTPRADRRWSGTRTTSPRASPTTTRATSSR